MLQLNHKKGTTLKHFWYMTMHKRLREVSSPSTMHYKTQLAASVLLQLSRLRSTLVVNHAFSHELCHKCRIRLPARDGKRYRTANRDLVMNRPAKQRSGSTIVCLSFHPMPKEHVHALKGLAQPQACGCG